MIDIEKIADELGITADEYKMLLTDYFEQVHLLVKSIEDGIRDNDHNALMMHGHSLKGLSANMGVDDVREQSLEIEAVGKNKTDCNSIIGNVNTIKMLIAALENA